MIGGFYPEEGNMYSRNLKSKNCISYELLSPPFFLVTHHTIGESVTSLRHRQALDHLWSHPGKRAHQGHVCCVGQKFGCPKITDLM